MDKWTKPTYHSLSKNTRTTKTTFPNKNTAMPHPNLLHYRTQIIHKADDPTWFQSVHKSEKKRIKLFLCDLVKHKADRVLMLQMESAFKLAIKEQRYYQTMLTYLHNGNQAKYEQYKTKTKEAMSEALTFMMEQESFNVEFVPDESQRSIDFGGGITMLINEKGDVARNEQAALRQGKKMKTFNDNLECFDAMAEFVELFK